VEGEGFPQPEQAPAPRTPFRRLARDLAIYGTGRIAFQVLLLLSAPILTRVFTTAEYGVLEIMTTLTAALGVIVILGLDSATQISYFDYPAEAIEKRRVVLSTTFWTLLGWAAIVLGVAAASSRFLADALFGGKYALVITLAIGALLLEMMFTFGQLILRVQGRPGTYSVLSVLWGVATLGFMLVLVAGLDEGLRGYYLGFLLADAVVLVVTLFVVRDSLRPVWDRRELRIMLAFGLPLIPLAASTWIMQLVDRFFLLHYASVAEVGVYGIGARLSNLLLLAVVTLGLAWSPFVFDLAAREPEEEHRVRARSLTYTAILLAFGALVVSVFARELFVTVIDAKFEEAYKVVGLLAGSVVAIGLNAVTSTGISLKRRTGYFARYAVYVAVLNIALNFLLIPPYGMVGAALATMLTYGALAVLYYHRAQLLDPAPFDLAKLLTALTVAAALIAIGTFVNLDPVWLSVLDAEALALLRRRASA
jgi:O-antigen/teichoic acid export membrane protein